MIAFTQSKIGPSVRSILVPFVALIAVVLTKSAHAQQPQLVLETGPGFVKSMAFSPDGKTLASSGRDHSTTLWDVTSGHPLRTLDAHRASAGSVAFSPHAPILPQGSDDTTITPCAVT